MTQQERIIEKLREDGEITSVWAFTHYILRLSERIRELQEVGYRFSKHFIEVDGKKTKTFRYRVEAWPETLAI